MIKKLTLSLAALLVSVGVFAQSFTGGIKGTVVNRTDKMPLQGAGITLSQNGEQIVKISADAQGNFFIPDLADGSYELLITAPTFLEQMVNVKVADGNISNLFNVSLTTMQNFKNTAEEEYLEFDMDDSGYDDSPTVLFGQSDPFNDIASYNFSSIRFKTRGYDSETQDVLLAGVKLNDAITGYTPFSLWSGLNEPTRTKYTVMGNEVSDYGFGGFNGLTNIPANPSNVRTGWRVGALTNSSFYRLRLQVTYSSGVLDNGWSYAFSASARLGGNDWIQGIYYRSFAYYLGVEKQFNDAHKLGFTFMGAPGERGAQNGSTQEVYDLVGDNLYNSNWGYQDGKMRNARVKKMHEPIAILKYDYTPSDKFKGSLTTLYRFGKNGYTALDWYDAPDPRPDYYRKLPSYYYMENTDYNRSNPSKALWAEEMWTNGDAQYTHIDWDRLYNVNKNNKTDYGYRSKYVQEERHTDQKDFHVVANFKWKATDSLTITGGANVRLNRSSIYKKIADLLGGDYYVDIDNFAERDYPTSDFLIQNDINYYLTRGTARILHKGDKYGYNYEANIHEYGTWLNMRMAFDHLDWNIAGRVGYTKFWRDGKYRKGLFPGLDEEGNPYFDGGTLVTSYDIDGKPITSYGASEKLDFWTYGIKSNLNFILNGGHKFEFSAGYYQDAPTFNESFVSPRTRNTIVPNLTNKKTFSADANYYFNNRGVLLRVTGFYTKIDDRSDVMSFYDDAQNSFTNFAMSGIDERHVGVEMGFQIPTFIKDLDIVGGLSWGQYVYTSNPIMTQTIDNSAEIVMSGVSVPYWKSHPIFQKSDDGTYVTDASGNYVVEKWQKHYVPSTPQLAASLGLSYFYKYWFIDANVNYFDGAYLDMNPLYRTDMACAGGDNIQTPTEIEYMAAQEKFGNAFIVNLSIGKSWYIQRKYQLGFNININNLLNNKDVKTGGYEQTRLVDNTTSKERYYRFDSKYFYMCGINYMLNLYFRF